MLNSQVDRQEPLYIFGPPKLAEFVDQTRRSLDMYINYEIIVKEFSEASTLWEDPEFTIRSFGLRHTKMCFGYTLEERMRPGCFHPEKAIALGVPCGPLWSTLQGGQDVALPNGATVHPGDVMGHAAFRQEVQLRYGQSVFSGDIARGFPLRSADLRRHVRGSAPPLRTRKAPHDGPPGRRHRQGCGRGQKARPHPLQPRATPTGSSRYC